MTRIFFSVQEPWITAFRTDRGYYSGALEALLFLPALAGLSHVLGGGLFKNGTGSNELYCYGGLGRGEFVCVLW